MKIYSAVGQVALCAGVLLIPWSEPLRGALLCLFFLTTHLAGYMEGRPE